MASEIVTGSSTTYLSIIGGSLKQKVTEDTDGAKERLFERKDGTEGSKFELTHKNVSGRLASFGFDKKDFGVTMLELVIVDSDGLKTQIGCADDSKYATSFMEKLPNIDLSADVVFNTYDFETTNKNTGKKQRKTGFSIVQGKTKDGEPNKIQSAYYDFNTGKNLLGLPSPEGDTDEFDTDDWKMYYLQKKKFLIKATKKIESKFVANIETKAEAVEEGKSVDDMPF